jgi:HD-GYP domain-containing protein (c-di-GMP phosphodiesterase class II)
MDKEMNVITIDDLKEGAVFDHTVFIEDNMVFIPPNIPVRKSDIEKLRKWGVAKLYTQGRMKTSDEKYIKTSRMWGIYVDTALVDLYRTCIREHYDLITQYKEKGAVPTGSMEALADRIYQKKDKITDLLRLALGNSIKEESLSRDSIDCALVSAAISQSMELSDPTLKKVLQVALVHDLGMMNIPDAIINKVEKLTAEELKLIRSHPLYSYQEITRAFKMSEEVAQIAIQHHERWDGEGYPQGLQKEEIALEARILSVADAYLAMTNERTWRKSMMGNDAVKNLLSDNSRRFDPDILKAFIRNIGIYPMGSLVTLNNSAICRVIDINSAAPLRPKIKVLINEEGTEFAEDTGMIIDLFEQKNLFITRSIKIDEMIKTDD